MTNAGDKEEKGTLTHFWWGVNWGSQHRTQEECRLLSKFDRTSMRLSSTKGFIFYYRDICTPMSKAGLLTNRKWSYLRCLSTDEWIIKMWYIYTKQFYSAVKKNETTKLIGK